MLETVKRLFDSQYEASLCMLSHCIARCPDALWSVPVAKYPFYQVAFHTLIFADIYLGIDEPSVRQQPFHLANTQLFGDYEQLEDREPQAYYTRPQIVTYLEFCRYKAGITMAAETEETLGAWTKFPRRNCSRAEMHLYNIRHIQHHAAQLILRLRLDTDVDIPWVGTGWVDSAPIPSTI